MTNQTRWAALFSSVFFMASAASLAAAPKPVRVSLVNSQGAVIGIASLHEQKDGVKVDLDAKDLTPGKHGIHFHEKGLCTGPDFKSAGGHLNPGHTEHGLENPKGPHAGDLPNILVGADGKVHTSFVATGVRLTGGDNALIRAEGAAIVIHAKVDDQKTNPSGDSGDRVACGVIQPKPVPN